MSVQTSKHSMRSKLHSETLLMQMRATSRTKCRIKLIRTLSKTCSQGQPIVEATARSLPGEKLPKVYVIKSKSPQQDKPNKIQWVASPNQCYQAVKLIEVLSHFPLNQQVLSRSSRKLSHLMRFATKTWTRSLRTPDQPPWPDTRPKEANRLMTRRTSRTNNCPIGTRTATVVKRRSSPQT